MCDPFGFRLDVRGRPELGPPTDRGGNVTVAWTAAPALFLSGQGILASAVIPTLCHYTLRGMLRRARVALTS